MKAPLIALGAACAGGRSGTAAISKPKGGVTIQSATTCDGSVEGVCSMEDIDDEPVEIDPLSNEALMASIGRVAVRSNELGDMIGLTIRYLRPGQDGKAWRGMTLGQKIKEAMKAANEGRLANYPGLKTQ